MAAYYLDTSALVKRYLQENGSAWVNNLMNQQPKPSIYLARVTGPEIMAAFRRKVNQKEISATKSQRTVKTFRLDWQTQFEIIEISPAIADLAMNLIEHYPLRGYDAIQLAVAVELNRLRLHQQLPLLTFVTADSEQLAVASAIGFPVENPNSYL